MVEISEVRIDSCYLEYSYLIKNSRCIKKKYPRKASFAGVVARVKSLPGVDSSGGGDWPHGFGGSPDGGLTSGGSTDNRNVHGVFSQKRTVSPNARSWANLKNRTTRYLTTNVKGI